MILSAKNIRRLAISAVLVLGLCLSVVLVYLYNLQLSKGNHCSTGGPIVEVAKAAQSIPKGTILTPEMVTFEKVPGRYVPPKPLLWENVHTVLYQRTNIELEQGSLILTSDFKDVSPSPSSTLQSLP